VNFATLSEKCSSKLNQLSMEKSKTKRVIIGLGILLLVAAYWNSRRK